MRNITLKKLRYAILASALMATSAFAGDPGDLFPDVNYEKSVSSPVSRPDSSIVRQDTAVYVTPRAQVKPPAPATVVKTPGTVTSTKPATPTEVASTKPATPADPNAIAAADLFTDKNPIYKIWGPYRLFTMKKFLNQSEQAEFDKEFSPAIKKALAVSQKDRQIAIEALTESSAKAAPAVKRLVLLNVVGLAIKNQNTLADRADRAMNVLPSLTDETLEVQQNKADCIYNLAMSAPDQANDTLWAMLCETEATLSILQVQSGFPKEALASLQKARAAYGKMYDRNAVHSEIMVEAQDWVKYANGASDAKNALKSILTEKPKDPDANNRVAMAYAVLYADLDAAEEYALNSGKEAVKTLGTTLKEVEFPKSGNDNAKVVSHSLRVAESLLAVAKAAPEQIERYALATLVYDRLDDLKEAYPNNTDNNMSSLHDAAKELIAANEYKAIVAPKVAPRPEPVANNTPNQPNNPNQQQQNAIQNFNERMQRLLRGGGGGGGFTGGGGRGGGRGGGGRGGRG